MENSFREEKCEQFWSSQHCDAALFTLFPFLLRSSLFLSKLLFQHIFNTIEVIISVVCQIFPVLSSLRPSRCDQVPGSSQCSEWTPHVSKPEFAGLAGPLQSSLLSPATCKMWFGWRASPTEWTWIWENFQEIAKDKETWHAAVPKVTKSWPHLSDWTTRKCKMVAAQSAWVYEWLRWAELSFKGKKILLFEAIKFRGES